MKKLYQGIRMLAVAIVLAAAWLPGHTQGFQHTFKGTGYDDYTAGMVVYTIGNPNLESSYIALGNTQSYGNGTSRILLVKYTATGTVLWSKTLYDTNAPNDEYHATDICAATTINSIGTMPPNNGTQPISSTAEVQGDESTGMYITGYTRSPGGNKRMFLMKVNASGNVLWLKKDFTPPTMDETGVAVECEPGGDVFVVGSAQDNMLLPPASHVSAARLNSAGTVMIWFNRYNVNTGGFSYAPRQACLYKDVQGYVGLGITGVYSATAPPGFADAFTLRINPAGGEA